jgi:hypothetical protein
VNTPNCGVNVNSASQQALCTTGQATINAPFINIYGNQLKGPKCSGSQSSGVSTGVGAAPDPFVGQVPWTNLRSYCNSGTTGNGFTFTGSEVTTTTTLPYLSQSYTVTTASGASIATTANVTCFSGTNVKIDTGVTLGSAPTSYTAPDGTQTYVGGNQIFVFENGVYFAGSATVSGTMDIQGGAYTSANNQVSMYAPAANADTYNALALMVDPINLTNGCSNSIKNPTLTSGSNACIQVQFGSGGYGSLDGYIYAPNATVYMQDNGGNTTVAGIVAGAIYDKASALNITTNYNLAHPSTTPLSTLAMVE